MDKITKIRDGLEWLDEAARARGLQRRLDSGLAVLRGVLGNISADHVLRPMLEDALIGLLGEVVIVKRNAPDAEVLQSAYEHALQLLGHAAKERAELQHRLAEALKLLGEARSRAVQSDPSGPEPFWAGVDRFLNKSV